MNNEKIAAMAAWTLENIQEDPLAAVEQVRELAAAYKDLQRERDAAVADLAGVVGCEYCGNFLKCEYHKEVPANFKPCHDCGKCVCATCDGHDNWEWRGPQERSAEGEEHDD